MDCRLAWRDQTIGYHTDFTKHVLQLPKRPIYIDSMKKQRTNCDFYSLNKLFYFCKNVDGLK